MKVMKLGWVDKTIRRIGVGFLLILTIPVICQKYPNKSLKPMKLRSNSFQQEDFIPARFTCDGSNDSPHLEWSDFPESTKCFALICDDPDAPSGTWVHWVVANIPVGIHHFDEHFVTGTSNSQGMIAGMNDFRNNEYGGPCPPGGTHRYFFRIFALDAVLGVKKGVTSKELQKLMEGHILATGILMGKYSRKR
jgi:Raf kinase inhibitor-like YbhB/YbcL family protein